MEHDITQIWVGSHQVGMTGLKKIFAEVKSFNLLNLNEIAVEIMTRVKRSNYIPDSAESRYAEALLLEYRRFLGEDVEEEHGILEIQILGPGCPRCEELMKRVKTVAAELDLPADIRHIRDLKKITGFGPAPTPVLVVNGQIKTTGKVPPKEELKKLLT